MLPTPQNPSSPSPPTKVGPALGHRCWGTRAPVAAMAKTSDPAAASASAAAEAEAMKDLMPEEEDYLYEEELLRNPYALKMWFRYLEARKEATPKRRYLLYERALRALPGSFKVHRPPDHPQRGGGRHAAAGALDVPGGSAALRGPDAAGVRRGCSQQQ